MILTSRFLTVLIAFTFTFHDCGKAYAQDSAPTETSSDEGDDKEQENFMDQVGDVAKDAAKEAAVDAAKSIAVGVAASVARQAAEAASSFGAGAAIGAAKKAAVAAKQAASYAQAVKGAAELKGFAKKSTQTLIVAIVFGLVGITAIVGCKKSDAPGNIPAPSFYIWTVGSIAFMISEIVHFIKFKTISKKIGKMELDLKNKQQLQALEQQRQLLSEALKTARGKKTWTQILQAAYIAAGVAALAELAIEILTEKTEISFDMKCGKDKEGEEGADGEQSTEQNTEVADTDAEPKKFNFGDAAKDGFNNAIGMDTGSAGGAGDAGGESDIIGDMAAQYTTQGVNKLFEEGEKAIKGDEKKDGENGENKDGEQDDTQNRDIANEGDEADANNGEPVEGEPPLQDDEEYCQPGDTDPECLGDDQARFYKKNKLLISESEFRDYKKEFLVDINSRVIMAHYASANSDQLIVDIMNSKTDLDSYFVFDEWHQLRHGGVISPSIVKYEKMNKHNIINSFFKKESKDEMGLKEVLGMSLKFIKDNAFIPSAHASGKKAGKAIGKIMVNILAGFAEKTITGIGEKAIEHFQNKEEQAFEKKYTDKEKELTKAQEELDAEIEKDAEEINLLKEKKTALEDRKREIAEERAEAAAEAAEEAAEAAEDEEDEDDEEEEEELLKVFHLEEEENEFDTDAYAAEFNDESEITEEQKRLDAEIAEKEKAKLAKEQELKDKAAAEEQIAAEQEQAEAQRESGVEGMARGKIEDLAGEGVDQGASFVSDGITNLGDKALGINQGSDKGSVAKTDSAIPEGGPQEGVKKETNANKGKLKDKINGLWQKLMGVYEKLFGSAPTRSALSAATALMINQWILKEIKKQVGLLEKNIAEIDKMIEELKSQEGRKVDENLMASKKDLERERDRYNPDMTNSRSAGSGSYASGIMSSKFGGMDGVCLSGQGSNMQLSGCGCAQSNSCTRFPQHKIDSQYFPSAVSYGQSSVYDMASSMTNGNYRAATLSGMDFAKNAASMYRKQKSLQAKINKMLKSKGMAPINFNKRAAAVMKKTFDIADASGVAEAYNRVHGSGRSRGKSAAKELDKVDQKQEFVTKANIPTINPKKRKGKGIKIEDIEEDEVQQVVSKEPASIEELDLPKEEIQDRPNTSLFDIIHVRYIKTAYPTLLSEETKSQ